MSEKAERPLKDAIEATFMEVPRYEAEIPSLGRTDFHNTRPHVGGEAMSVKADRPLKDGPLKDLIEATFV